MVLLGDLVHVELASVFLVGELLHHQLAVRGAPEGEQENKIQTPAATLVEVRVGHAKHADGHVEVPAANTKVG